jgi:dipeptidyl aminopeptidase/acylaminoacyl peptidase
LTFLLTLATPQVNPAWHTRTQIYLVPLSPRTAADAKPKIITVGTQGAASSPAFSKDGKRIAWLEMREDGNEADRNRVVVYEIESGRRWGATENWDRSPGSVSWCPCGEKLYLITEDQGHVKLFQLGVPVERSDNYVSPAPDALTSKHVVNSISPITKSSVLITSSSFTTPNTLSILTLDPRPSTTGTPPPSASLSPLATLTPTLSSKSLDKGESFWFSGSEGVEVHGFIMFPPNYSESSGKKYPLAFIVHGGPQSAFTDSWSTRWNPQIYAAAGYITVLIKYVSSLSLLSKVVLMCCGSPTGSTGYGQDFTDAIQNQWGGKPFQDLVAGLEFVKSTFPIDPSRMVRLHSSLPSSLFLTDDSCWDRQCWEPPTVDSWQTGSKATTISVDSRPSSRTTEFSALLARTTRRTSCTLPSSALEVLLGTFLRTTRGESHPSSILCEGTDERDDVGGILRTISRNGRRPCSSSTLAATTV